MRKHVAIGIIVLASIGSLPASASLIAPQTQDCPAGQYVVGLSGRTGWWIDAIVPVCAPWDGRLLQAGSPHARLPVGGHGGGSNQQSCPAGSAVAAWKVEGVRAGDQAFAEAVSVQCRTLAPPHGLTPAGFRFAGGGNLPPVLRPPQQESCPAGQLATGVYAWVSLDGRFITDVKMRCGAAPFVQSVMAAQGGTNGTVTYFSPTLKLPSGDGVRLDWCREWANDCGAPAADAFCKSRGKVKAAHFAAQANVGLTMVISSKQICNAPNCTAFASIECSAVP
jgi:hypothetical protein